MTNELKDTQDPEKHKEAIHLYVQYKHLLKLQQHHPDRYHVSAV